MLIVGVMFYLLNLYTPLYADDYKYLFGFGDNQGRIENLTDIAVSQYSHYFNMNGRIATHSLAQLFLLIGKPAFNIINTFAFILLGIIIYYHAYLSIRRVRVLPLLFVFFALFISTPKFGQSYLWVTGASNYLYGPIITLIFLVPYRISFSKSINNPLPVSIVSAVLMFILGVVAGNANENNGILAVVVSFTYLNTNLFHISIFLCGTLRDYLVPL